MTVAELEQCVDMYGRELYAFCRRMAGSTAEGDDLYQETFLTAMEKLDKIKIEKNPKSYLFTIAVHLWKNKNRKQKRRKALVNFESMEQKADEGIEAFDDTYLPEDTVIANEMHIQVNKCVNSLDYIYRMPICLYYISQLSTKEIAKILRLPEGTVKSRLYAGRKKIKKNLEDLGYD